MRMPRVWITTDYYCDGNDDDYECGGNDQYSYFCDDNEFAHDGYDDDGDKFINYLLNW